MPGEAPEPNVLLRNLLVFGRLLRRLGLDVHSGRMMDVIEALTLVDLGSREDVYHTCRTLLVHRHEDIAPFDRAFEAFWLGRVALPPPAAPSRQAASSGAPRIEAGRGDAGVDDDDSVGERVARTWSEMGALTQKDLAAFTAEEIAVAREAFARLTWHPGDRRTRRWERGRGPRVDLRRAIARSLRTGGDVVTLPQRRRRIHPRPLVLLCDVSGSMERYSRMLLHFAHALRHRHGRVEAFLFSTRLTRITTELRHRRLDEAVTAVAKAVPDWSGGTRTGEALRELHQRWMRRVLHGGPVVLLISDGWDRGDPVMMREQVARLQRSCHRLIWLNPLAGTAGYEPLTRGLQAALPFVDDFLPARTLADFADLAVHLNALSAPARRRR